MSNDRTRALESKPIETLDRPPRVLLFGRDCPLSIIPLRWLIKAGIDVIAVACWRNHPTRRPVHLRQQPGMALPLANAVPATLQRLAADHGIALVEIGDLTHPETAELVTSMEPDIVAVSCFPRLIPAALLAIPRLGAINLHPSLLPQLRGPDPLFWTFRLGLRRSGLTVHLMNDQFDAGPILRSQEFDVPNGISGDELEKQAASIGGELLLSAVLDMAHGVAQHVPQAEQHASYQSWPDRIDLMIDLNWEAGTIWNFARGVLPLGYTPTIRVEDREYSINQAIRFSPNGNANGFDVIKDRALTLIREDGTIELGVKPLDATTTTDTVREHDQ